MLVPHLDLGALSQASPYQLKSGKQYGNEIYNMNTPSLKDIKNVRTLQKLLSYFHFGRHDNKSGSSKKVGLRQENLNSRVKDL